MALLDRRLLAILLIPFFSLTVVAAKKNANAKEGVPKVMAVSPLAVSPGTTTIRLVGVKIDQARSIVFGDPETATTQPTSPTIEGTERESPTARIVDRDKVDVPRGLDANEVGDKILTIELVVPKDCPEGELPLSLLMPDGTRLAFKLLVVRSRMLVEENESSTGFQQAQTVQNGQWIRGTVRSAGEVAVFRISGKKGQVLHAEVIAHRRHSLLDSLLVLYDGHRNIVTENDDANDTDSLIRYALPDDGDYFLSLTDATDHGGAGYPYLLSITLTGPAR